MRISFLQKDCGNRARLPHFRAIALDVEVLELRLPLCVSLLVFSVLGSATPCLLLFVCHFILHVCLQHLFLSLFENTTCADALSHLFHERF